MNTFPFPDYHWYHPRDNFYIVRMPIEAVFTMAKSHRRKMV
jgi:hypothetical protein